MGDFLNLDNKFFQGVGKVVDCIWLSILWLIFSIPVITSGAATTALYYTVNKVVRNGRGYIWQEFWSSFKSNLKQSTLIWFIVTIIYAVLGFDLYVMYQMAKAGDKLGSFYMVFVVLIALVTMWVFYLFPYLARFVNTTKQILKNSAYMAIFNLPWTIVLFVLFLAVVMGLIYMPPIIMVVPAVYTLLKNLILEKIFKKYMSPEDIAAEEERNREYFN